MKQTITVHTIRGDEIVALEESHHPDCPAIDYATCRCAALAASVNPYTERGLEDRTKPIGQLVRGLTAAQIDSFFDSH